MNRVENLQSRAIAPKTSAIRIIGNGEIENIAVSAYQIARSGGNCLIDVWFIFRIPLV
jgi:hypothetical protein